MTHTPHRFSERSVYRFAPLIKTFLERPDNIRALRFDPSTLGLNVETAMARLRDAVKALSSGTITYPGIDKDILKSIWPRYKVTFDGDDVVICPRQTEKEATATLVDTTDVIAVVHASNPRLGEILGAFALLLGLRLLTGKVKIVGTLPEGLTTSLLNSNDIAFQPQDDNTTLMF